MSAIDWFVNWTDAADAAHVVVRAVPAAIMFPVIFVVVQALMTVSDAHDLGNAAAIRATLHGSHLDVHGLAWSLGIASVMTLWGVIARRLRKQQ